MLYKKNWNQYYLALLDIDEKEPNDTKYKKICFRNLKWEKRKTKSGKCCYYSSSKIDFYFENEYKNLKYLCVLFKGKIQMMVEFDMGIANVPDNSILSTYLNNLLLDK